MNTKRSYHVLSLKKISIKIQLEFLKADFGKKKKRLKIFFTIR